MAFRRFVLVPAAEVAGELLHPTTGRTLRELLDHLDTAANYVAVVGAPGTSKSELVSCVCAHTGSTPILEQLPATGISPDSPGPRLAAEIQFLDHRLELLEQIDVHRRGNAWISDFWLEQSFAFLRLDDKEMLAFERIWQDRSRSAIAPKLIVLLETTDRSQNEINSALSDRVSLPCQPPVLKLDAAEPQWNDQELAAAVLAMQ